MDTVGCGDSALRMAPPVPCSWQHLQNTSPHRIPRPAKTPSKQARPEMWTWLGSPPPRSGTTPLLPPTSFVPFQKSRKSCCFPLIHVVDRIHRPVEKQDSAARRQLTHSAVIWLHHILNEDKNTKPGTESCLRLWQIWLEEGNVSALACAAGSRYTVNALGLSSIA